MTKEKQEVAVWQPKKFDGSDLLPMEAMQGPAEVAGVPQLAGREHIDAGDLIVPSLSLLQDTSKAVKDKLPGAVPGVFFHSATEEIIEPPVRLILAHYHKGNALFPKEDPRYEGLETCIAPDGVQGTVYGLCEECRKCYWKNEGKGKEDPPLGAEVHHFVAFTNHGPAMIRFTRSSFKSGSRFLSAWTMSRKNLWVHPAVLRVYEEHKTLRSGKATTFQVMSMTWQVTERVPDELQRAAFHLYKEVSAKHEAGQLKTQDEGSIDEPSFD